MVFYEIIQEVICSVLENCCDIDENLVYVQEICCILDCLVGYIFFFLFWKKIVWGLFVGWVQLVVVWLIVQWEWVCWVFKIVGYWDLKVELEQNKNFFQVKLMILGGIKLVNGSDFDFNIGVLLFDKQVVVLDEVQAIVLKECLIGKFWVVVNIEEKFGVCKLFFFFIIFIL